MHELWMEGAPGSFSIPDNPYLVGLFATAIFNQHFPLENVLQDKQRQRSHIVLRTRDMPASRYLEVVRDVERFAASEAPLDVSVRLRAGTLTCVVGHCAAGKSTLLRCGGPRLLISSACLVPPLRSLPC